MRYCPKCQNITEAEIVGGVELDRCSECEGILLDKGELGLLVREGLRGEAEAGPPPAEVNELPARCDDCNCAMERRVILGTRVEVCPSCGAIFLDKGELAAVQAAARGRR